MNADAEVDRFLRVFGLLEKRHMPIQISAVDSTGRVPIPTPTTHDAAVPYYVEISGPVSRQSLNTIAEFAGDEDQNEAPLKLGKDKVYFIILWAVSCLTWHNSSRRLAQVNLPVHYLLPRSLNALELSNLGTTASRTYH